MQFMERAHGLRAQTAGFEFVVGFDGGVHLIGISRVHWQGLADIARHVIDTHLNPRFLR